jgi:hypothetical protein
MGLLDDAIREHLELKRRRGADPTEVERLEREALGPVRRAPHEPADVAMDEPEAAAPVAYPDGEPDHDWVEAADDEPLLDPAAEYEPEAPRHHEIAEEWDAHEPLDFQEPPEPLDLEEPATTEHFAAQTPPPAAAEPPPGDAPPPAPAPDPADHLGEETAEFDVEAAQAAEGDGEDMLEETPEFLQDTPDHDRLWFEQRPPRDFDFDG